MRRHWLVLTLVACGHEPPADPPAPTPVRAVAPESPPPASWACEPLPFADTTPVPEASAAAWLGDQLMTVGDSGNHGAYGLLDPGSGATVETGKLPLGDAGDDLEGLAIRDGIVYGLNSAGWMRAWKRDGSGFALIDGPYPLGPVDLPNKPPSRAGDKPPEGDGMVCGARGVNCGRNYEGLCLPAHPKGPCTGFVLAKADGHLYCLADDPDHAGRFVVKRTPSLVVGAPGRIADCAFAADADDLYVAGNLFDNNEVYRVAPWSDLASAKLVPLAAVGVGFDEGVAVKGDLVFRFSDLGGAPSLVSKFRCSPAAR